MSDISFLTTEKGNLLNFYYFLCQEEPTVTEFNTVECSITGYFLLIEIHIWKEEMNIIK